MEVDIACAGFGPAMGGFLTTLTQAWTENPADPAFESKRRAGHAAAGALLRARRRSRRRRQRRGDARRGHSRQLSRARSRRDSHGRRGQAGARPLPARSHRRQPALRALASWRFFSSSWRKAVAEGPCLRAALDAGLPAQARRPGALHRPVQPVGRRATDGQRPGADLARHAGQRAASSERRKARWSVAGLRLADQGVDKLGAPADGFMAGMDVRAQLTVVGDGPVGAVGQARRALRPADGSRAA